MRIDSFQAFNYKSVRQLEEFPLTEGFNIVAGQNAAGKTALLEILSLRFSNVPHRSTKTVPNRGDRTDQNSVARVRLTLSGDEMRRILRNDGGPTYVPIPGPASDITHSLGVTNWSAETVPQFANWFLEVPTHTFYLELTGTGAVSMLPGRDFSLDLPYAPVRPPNSSEVLNSCFTVNLAGKPVSPGLLWVQPPNNDIGSKIAPQIRNLIYRFSSERSVRARSPHGYGTTLAPNAANLPEVLNALQANAAAFEEFNRLVSEVLPQIRWVSVRPVSEGYEIVVWSIEKATKRDDLAVPLDQTGSGVGQVLAILYVLVTAYEPKAIIIDEPQSFLHPSSAIKLVSILNRHPQHQFILATHSPSIIAAASPKNILALTYQDAETRLEVFDLHKAASFKSFLDAAGLEFQDLFGADNILWVEGPTEEHAFPEIIDALTNIRMMGTVIRPVSATGDLEGQDAERVFKIYRTLTHGNAILPPALAFVLDSESRSAQGLLELTKQSQERAVFLPRRMFENYLLRVEAIAAIANSIPDFTAQPINPKDVSDKIDEKKTQKAYFAPLPVSSDWAQKINASKLLKDIFGELSDHRVEYRKPDHSVRITRWLLQNHPEDLREIADVLQQAFAKSPALGTVSST